jgi:hypothetical protein
MVRKGTGSLLAFLLQLVIIARSDEISQRTPLLNVGVSAVSITPFGPNPDWDGTVTDSGVWGEKFTDRNHNGRWDPSEAFQDDPGNDQLDSSSEGKYDGIYLAGFGGNRLASGKHDDLWARALVLESSDCKIAIVSVDLIGYYSRPSYFGPETLGLGLSEILITSTHNHEGPDTIGPWGFTPLSDGKYPKYLRFVNREIAKAIVLAANSSVPARMKLGRTDPRTSPALAGMQTRTGGRPPDFFDEELRVMQFVGLSGAAKDKVIATMINWNTHPASMQDKNRFITSDFPHAVRESVERRYGGTAVYTSGDLGAVEIVGDSQQDQNERTRFDGKNFKRRNAQELLPSFERTEGIGRDVAKAVVDALEMGEWSPVSGIEIKKSKLRMPMDNVAYSYLAQKGVLDVLSRQEDTHELEIETKVFVITLGDAQIITTPGELFPEVFYGVESYRRRDCPAANTGRPYEPSVRERMTRKYRFVLGLCPDELGYLVPGYDFLAAQVDPAGPASRQAEDACRAKGVPSHYHETNSASSQLAAAWACTAVQLLDGSIPDTPACRGVAKYIH